MENSSASGKNNTTTSDNNIQITSQKGKAETFKKEVQHSRLKESSHNNNKYHIRGTASQSTIEYTKSGEQTKCSAGQRSKSFLEESALSKAANCSQTAQCGKRSTQGSHGDGLFYPHNSKKGKRYLHVR